ncbi:TrmH family RNA methyltransferase [Streptomyces sp. SHP 1-2]|uniref:TrmH family RNA methyltransferase n=1 Tax=Streptomyces sp. SHP 1-2 TaxID=2769489 RepID=UPI002238837E|nr:RNA methyltransferase [Streptomyces sp. SHP 1-2]MCW5254642.1 RNA methyltransferase [Streptomyces sp. SHP 1-2]
MADLITSTGNPVVKRMRQLSERKHRRREGAFVVEGVQPVWQAVEAGAGIEVLVVAPELLRYEPALRMVREQEERGVRVVRVGAGLFTRLSERDGPSGLAAIVRGRLRELDEITVRPDSRMVVLYEVANPGNLGTIVRTADATDTAAVILIGKATDPFDPAAVKASMGALFNVPVAHAATADEFFSWAADRGVTVATTSAAAESNFWTIGYPTPLAILLGAEGPGLPAEVLERGDIRLHIPMVGTAESLNLAVSAGVLLYEAWRGAGGPQGAPAGGPRG